MSITIGQRIRARREELNMTQEELAKKLGYANRSSVNKVETSREVSMKKIDAFAKALDTTTAYLMGWENFTEQAAIVDADLLCLTPKQKDYIIRISKLSEDKQECLWSVVDNFEKLNEGKEE